ncbi:acyltransferase family protein [Bythopirellula goksoeyrii]|uniref:DUF5009 domain-containing protein n=1 Tax=Bythopirellula goksoeyrii TaxID=1400387 RepID=A0A5B9QEI9_9BACT|nr:DUF5009 domain-containing protein [Bythopirellula goksoeyrii]QEG36299.1 hypothetical protein Pr1d_36110 [Bythopirellula goksoeyrii]
MLKPISDLRLKSLDALRGFDMFWIMGVDHIFHQLGEATGSSFWHVLDHQFQHPDWHGFAVYDLIFPLFLFLAGVAMPYSIGKKLEAGLARSEVLYGLVKRGLILVLLGVIYNNGLEVRGLDEIRFPSVLGRIGLAYMFAGFIYVYTKQRSQVLWCITLLLGYWLLLMLGSASGYPRGDLTEEGNIVSYVDRIILPGQLYRGIHDPEGLLATIPAVSTALMGILAGTFLENTGTDRGKQNALTMAFVGIAFVAVAQLWNLSFPINKNLWTSSFAMQCGGLSLMLLAFFYFLIDVKGWTKWAFFFRVIGMNSIFIYMSPCFIDWQYTSSKLFGWMTDITAEPYKPVIMTISLVGVQWLFLYFLYRNKVFLRI